MLKNGCIRGNWNERHLLERRVAQYSKRMGVRSLVMAAQGSVSPSSNRSTLISSFSASSQGSVHLPLSVSEPLRSNVPHVHRVVQDQVTTGAHPENPIKCKGAKQLARTGRLMPADTSKLCKAWCYWLKRLVVAASQLDVLDLAPRTSKTASSALVLHCAAVSCVQQLPALRL